MDVEKALAEADRNMFELLATATANKAVVALLAAGIKVTPDNAVRMAGQWLDVREPQLEAVMLRVNDHVEQIIMAGAKVDLYDI